eukprot:3262534-Prymnesium_polylepis.1
MQEHGRLTNSTASSVRLVLLRHPANHIGVNKAFAIFRAMGRQVCFGWQCKEPSLERKCVHNKLPAAL